MEKQPIALMPCRIGLFLAGYLIEAAHREEWRQEWLGELWYRVHALRARQEWDARSALHLYLSCLGCFRDAWCQMTSEDDRWTGIRMQMRAPGFCAGLLIAGLICLAMSSGYFSATRTILSGLPYKDAARLALVSRTGRLEGIRRGIPRQLADSWFHQSKLLQSTAAFSFAPPATTRIDKRDFDVSLLQATGNLFEVMGLALPIGIRPAVEAVKPVALLSFSFWQRELQSDPKVVGKRLWQNHQSCRIIGVLPSGFWFVSPSVRIYVLNSVAVSHEGTLLVRSRPDVSARQLEDDLEETADRNETPFIRTAPHVLFLADAVRTPVWLFGSSLFIAMILAGVWHSSRLRRGDRGEARLPQGNWRWWLFLFAKTTVALLLVFTVGVETFVGFSHQFATEPLGGPALLWFYTAACSSVLFAVIADQQTRCRVCLQCLAFPIRVGCPGCLFLDWSGTELLCPDGHGMLYVPHHVSCWDEAERWVALES